MVDFDMNEEDAVIEAIEELNVRGIDHSDLDLSQQRLGAEGGADESKVFEFLSKLVSAAEVHDVATVELQLSNLRPLSINFDSIAEDANFDTVLFGLTSAVLILDNTNFCHFAFSILFGKTSQRTSAFVLLEHKQSYSSGINSNPAGNQSLRDCMNTFLPKFRTTI